MAKGEIASKASGISVGVGPAGKRRVKKPCLYVKQGKFKHEVAVFRSEEDAEWFLDKFRQFAGVKEVQKVGRKWYPVKPKKKRGAEAEDGIPDDAEQTENENVPENPNQEEELTLEDDDDDQDLI